MKYIITIILSISSLFALNIRIKQGIEKNHPYSILHIRSDKAFLCDTVQSPSGEAAAYICRFDKMPSERLNPIKSKFFSITFSIHKKGFICHIVPAEKSVIYALPKPIYQDPILKSKPDRVSTHWIIIGYKKVLPYLGHSQNFDDKLSFPLDFSKYRLPSVGAVDIDGEPIFIKNNQDVVRFIAIKRTFASGKFKRAYDKASNALQKFPHSIFASDFLRYEIKSLASLDMKENSTQIIKKGKFFIRHYTSDEYLPEVLLILARVYSATGFISDANYFFDRLIHEHKGSKFANLGLIYLGDQLYVNGKPKDAIDRYLQAYYGAKDINVASLAAYKLGLRYLNQGKTEKAYGYFEKIWDKNPSFLLKDKQDAHHIAQQLARRDRYSLAIKIDKALLKKFRKIDEPYEQILFEIAKWYDEKGDIKDAIDGYKRYLGAFAYGKYSDKAKKNLDKLFVVSPDINETEALKRFDTLMNRYKGTDIAQKALAAKAKLFLRQKRYSDVLALKKEIDAMNDDKVKDMALLTLKKAAMALFVKAYGSNECETALIMKRKYGLDLKRKYDDFLYSCDLQYADYQRAQKIAKSHIHDKSIDSRALWMCRIVHVLSKTGKVNEAFKASKDLQALNAQKECPTLDWDLAEILKSKNSYAKLMVHIASMSKKYSKDIRMAKLYKVGYDAAKRQKDTEQQIWMIAHLMSLQRQTKTDLYSPWAEFQAISLYKSESKYKKALTIAQGMSRLKLKGENRARWLYELGLLYQKNRDMKDARNMFKSCNDIKNGGAWRKLCGDALSM